MKYSIIKYMIVVCLFCGCTQEGPYKTALLGSLPKNFDPTGVSEVNEITLMSQICGRLTALDDALNIQGDLAEDWDISPDRKTYKFKLKKNLHFQTGTLLTAKDVVFTFQRMLNDHNSFVSTWVEDFEKVEILDDDTVSIKLSRQSPDLLYRLSHPKLCVLEQQHPFINIDGVDVPNSVAPYRVSRIIQPDTVILSANGLPYQAIEEEISVRYLDQGDALKEFKSGNLHDLSFYLLDDDEINPLKDQSKVLRSKLYWTWLIVLNPSKGYFSQKPKRLEFVSKFNRRGFLKLWGSDIRESSSMIPYGVKGYAEQTNLQSSVSESHLPACAQPLKVAVIRGMPLENNLEKAVQNEITAASGCPVDIAFIEMGDWIKDWSEAISDVYIFGTAPNSLDPLSYYRYFIGGGSENTIRAQDELLDQAYWRLYQKPIPDRSENDYRDILDAFYSTGFGVALGHPSFKFVYSKDVKHIHMNPFGMELNRWWKIGRK